MNGKQFKSNERITVGLLFDLKLTLQHARCIELFGSRFGTIRSFSSIEGSIEDTMRVSRGDSAHEESADEILRGGVFGRLEA